MGKLSVYLKELRGELSIREVAKNSGVSNAYLSQLESGERDQPHPEILKKLADYYKRPVVEFLMKAGYLEENIAEESFEEKIDRLLQYVTSKPGYKYGHRKIKHGLTLDVKRFIIEMYEKASGEKLL